MKNILFLFLFFRFIDAGIGVGISSSGALPVELNSFTASYTAKGIILNWQTATEVNNFGFEVQRSESDENQRNWIPLSFVQGHGTTSSPKDYFYTDSELPSANKIYYRLKQIDNDGTYAYSKELEVDISSITDIKDENLKYDFVLEQNHPNPFNPSTIISYSVPSSSQVSLKVFNVLGKEVASLVDEIQSAGNYEAIFDASYLNSGVYFYRIKVVSIERKNEQIYSTKKMMLIK